MDREGLKVLSGPMWLALAAGTFACVIVGISAERTYAQAQIALLDAQQEQVRLTVQTSARLLDERVKIDFDKDPLGVHSAKGLESICRLNQQIDAAYILTPNRGGLLVQNIFGKSSGIRRGMVLTDVLPAAHKVLESGISQVDSSSFESDESSSVKSFAAIYRNGKIAGVLGIDYKSIKFLNRTDSVGDTQRSGWLLAFLVGMLSCVAVYTVRFRQLKEANELRVAKDDLEEANHLLENRVEQRTEELRQALDSKSMFLMSAGHELRTPLNGLMGMTTLALDTDLSEEQQEYFTHAKSSALQLTHKVNQLLDLASLETGSLRIELEETIVGDELERAIEKHKIAAFAKRLEVVVEIDPQLFGKFLVAKRRLHQIVDNLSSNAVKFTEEGQVSFKANLKDRGNGITWLDIEIEDSGCGLEDSSETVFDLKHTHNLPSNKTGLGIALTISRRITQLMGGVMEVGETDGRGTKMKVTIPLPRASGNSMV